MGLAYTGPISLGSQYDAAIVAGMVATLDKSDLDLVFLNLQRDKKLSESYMQFFHRKGIRGVVLRTTKRTRNVCEAITDEGFPCVVVGDRFDREGMNYVYCDSSNASYQGMEHLIALGHRRIALAISDLVKDSDHEDRLKAYEQALEDHDIKLDRKLYFHIPPSHPDGAQVVRRMLSMAKPPTAIFFTDPLVAVGAINEAHKLGIRIPDDLSILGFDDTEVRHHVSPTMTSICQDARRLGIEGITMLSQVLDPKYDGTPVTEDLSTWLEVNGTTAAVKG
ncbi:MAG: substrate-binding domain-containing protein [Planctomycetota bacterium]|nr:substrate-binding domain-containing protein [Planctomycetota bacterium]